MDQKLQTILVFVGTSCHSLYADFAYQLFIVGLENKSTFFYQYLKHLQPIVPTKEKEDSFSKLKKKNSRKSRKRKKRSKKQCKFGLTNYSWNIILH